MKRLLKTTKPVRRVETIDDIAAIEATPYDELITARNLHDLFAATAQHCGDRPALTVLRSPDADDVGISLTHRELLGEITRTANMFRRLGLAPGKGVAAFLSPTLPELPALLLGAQVAGVASSLNYLLSREAIFDLLDAEGATILVVPARSLDEMCWDKTQGVFDHVPSLQRVLVIGDDPLEDADGFTRLVDALSPSPADALDFEPSQDRNAVCALFHTGGTTGRPKLVRLTAGNQIHAAFSFAQVFGYYENDVVINGFPFFHVGGTMTVGLSVLAAGAHMIVPSPYALRPPAVVENYWRLVEDFGVTVINGVPTSIAALTNTWHQGIDTSSVRMALTGGAVLPKAVGSRFEATTGIRLYETYGMTETAAAIAFNPGRGEPLAGSVGFRAPFSQTRIVRLDTDDDTPCEPGESGVVQVKGPQVFPGYVDQAHNIGTLDGDGWLTTGDVGYLRSDGRLVLTGREKDLIVRSGHNIDPAAIEDVANQFAGVHISAAVGMPDQYAGEVPALFVVPAPGMHIDLAALKAHLEAHVHEPPARPRSIMVIDALPVTAVGKIYKPALRDMAIEEKVRLELGIAAGSAAKARVTVSLDAQKHTLVDVEVTGATAQQIAALEAALQPLPQTYRVSPAASENADEGVLLAVEGGVATITLNRPASRNALSQSMVQALESRLREAAAQPGLRVLILAATGEAFCAGGDLVEFEQARQAGGSRLIDMLAYNLGVIQMIEDFPVPVIAAVNGVAVAGGLELLLACDIIVAAEGARLGDGHAKYGIVPAGGATVRLPERIGTSRAALLFNTASLLDAATLRDWGLVNETVPKDRLMARAVEIAQEICRCSPKALAHVRWLTRPGSRDVERQRRMYAEIERFALHLDGPDLEEGLTAFREKRPPVYGDRKD
jgi:acyl-CoA synthetase (AMP-forming)/AMP-acid ligase II/enoyl-CoA hydratase/carnithine racemase